MTHTPCSPHSCPRAPVLGLSLSRLLFAFRGGQVTGRADHGMPGPEGWPGCSEERMVCPEVAGHGYGRFCLVPVPTQGLHV